MNAPVPIPQTFTTGGEALRAILGLATPSAAVYPTEINAGGIPALDRGISLVANAVASMMTEAIVVGSHTRPPILAQPHPFLTAHEFWSQAVRTAMMRGNAIFVLADHDEQGYARQAVPVHPDAVSFDTTTGMPRYTIGEHTFDYWEVAHIRAGAPPGSLWGRGILENHPKTLSLILHQMEYRRTGYASGGVPSAVISLDTAEVTPEQAAQVQEGWLERHSSGLRKPAVVGRSLSITPLAWSPEQVEAVEASKLTVAECAFMCGLRPEDLGASVGGSSLTYGNRQDDALQRITDSYSPWLQLIEQTWSRLVPGGAEVRGNEEALLRTSTRERYELHKLAQEIGIETADESRQAEGKPALPKDTTE